MPVILDDVQEDHMSRRTRKSAHAVSFNTFGFIIIVSNYSEMETATRPFLIINLIF